MNEPNIALESESFLLVSDIHAEMDALEMVLAGAPEMRYKCFLGDSIGRDGPNPSDVVSMIASFDVGVAGNYDTLALGKNDSKAFNPDSVQSVENHVKELSEENLRVLSNLTSTFSRKNMLFFHGSPNDENTYLFNSCDLKPIFENHVGIDLFFGGHLHIPRLASYDRKSSEISFVDITTPFSSHFLDLKKKKYLINIPSVAPSRFRDYKPGACFVFHHSETQKFLNFYFVN